MRGFSSSPPGASDVAEEGTMIAHELLHALGVPHPEEAGVVMSATKEATVHRLSPATVALAQAATQARWAHWDPEVAAILLADAAETWLSNRQQRVDYVARNLAAGHGQEVQPDRAAALARAALGQHVPPQR